MTGSPKAAFLIGAQKAGSSFLHNLLVANGPFRPARVKEPHYFTSDRRREAFEPLFEGWDGAEVLLDSSTSYLHNPTSAAHIAERFPQAPIVAILRPPLRRIASAYRHLVKHGCETRPLSEVLHLQSADYADLRAEELDRAHHAQRRGRIVLRRARPYPRDMADDRHDNAFWNFCYVSNSFYAEQLAPFRDAFDRVLVLSLPDLAQDPIEVLQRTMRFLGADLGTSAEAELDRNESRVTRKRAIREYLANLRADRSAPPAASFAALRGTWPLLTGATQNLQMPHEDAPWLAPITASYAAAHAPPIPQPKEVLPCHP